MPVNEDQMSLLLTESLCLNTVLIHGIEYINIINIDENMEELYSLPSTPPASVQV